MEVIVYYVEPKKGVKDAFFPIADCRQRNGSPCFGGCRLVGT